MKTNAIKGVSARDLAARGLRSVVLVQREMWGVLLKDAYLSWWGLEKAT